MFWLEKRGFFIHTSTFSPKFYDTLPNGSLVVFFRDAQPALKRCKIVGIRKKALFWSKDRRKTLANSKDDHTGLTLLLYKLQNSARVPKEHPRKFQKKLERELYAN